MIQNTIYPRTDGAAAVQIRKADGTTPVVSINTTTKQVTIHDPGGDFIVGAAGGVGADLTAIEALTGTGYAKRTGVDTWALDTPAGTGDVVGPASATDAHVVVFDSTTGKLVKDGGHALSEYALSGHNHDAAYLAIAGKAADSDQLDGHDTAYFATAGHDHDAAYLGIAAKAADSDKLDGIDSTGFATSGHNHSGVYQPAGSYAASGANTDLTSVYLSNTGLKLQDTNASHGLIIAPGSDLTADRTLTITTGDAARTLTLTGAASVEGTNTGDQVLPTRDSLGLDTDDSPQFAAIELGHATDTTIGRVSAGVIAVEGVQVSLAGHTHAEYEPTITAGTVSQYWRGDKAWTTLNQAAVTDLTTVDSPQFAALNVGHASDTTITRVSAGVIAVEGVNVSLEGHTHAGSGLTAQQAMAIASLRP